MQIQPPCAPVAKSAKNIDELYPLAAAPAVCGTATGGFLNINAGGGPYDYIAASLNKGYANTREGVPTYQDIYLTTAMNTDGVHASGIFSNSTYVPPDLSFNQRVNWLSPGTDNFGVISGSNVTEYFRLTSVIQSAVPEPNSITLA